MNKHTPGPWVIDGLDISPKFNDEISICAVQVVDAGGAKGWFNGESTAANARLIAAAPDLLEALEACMDYGSMTGHDWVIEKALAAISKARGEV